MSVQPLLRRVSWVVLSLFILVLDFITGPVIRFPVTFLIPVTLAAWNDGYRWGLAYAIVLPLIRFGYDLYWSLPEPAWFADGLNAIIEIGVFILLGYLVDKVRAQKAALEREVKILEGLLPICSFCKKIRNPDGKWEQMEQYITDRSEAKFSHSICPDCGRAHYPELNVKW